MKMKDIELELYKRNIHLAEFAIAHGAKVLPRSSINSFRLQIGDDKLLVFKNANNHYLFTCINDNNNKKGSIIDFCNIYLNMNNLGEIKKYLKEYMLNNNESFNLNAVKKQEHSNEKQLFDIDYYALKQHPLFTERQLDFDTIDVFLHNVKIDKHNNLYFAMYDENSNTIGYEVKNIDYKANYMSKQGLAILGLDTMYVKNIVICESVIDALSFYELNKDKLHFTNTLLVSTSGTLTDKQMFILYTLLTKDKKRTLFVAFDNDKQGNEYTEKLKNYLSDKHIQNEIKIEKSVYKDFNDDLKMLKNNNNVNENINVKSDNVSKNSNVNEIFYKKTNKNYVRNMNVFKL